MSDVWNEGYFTDVGYTYGYYRDISPVFQRFCLLIRGFAVSEPTAEAQHCELGFGQGVSINIHAAATPGQYLGTDFNPAHAAHAHTLAAASGSGARLFDDSFEQLLNRSDLPQFDSISLHGIWTWVSRDNHKIITEFARRHLKPGGIFYNSYNCFPGWSPAYPLRQLFALHDRFAGSAHSAASRVDAALKFSDDLLSANPIYANAAPQLRDKLKSLMGQNRNYLAHEYFNREWNCMYFTDVVDALAPAKLDYACTATPLDTLNEMNLSQEGVTFLNAIEHPILREQVRDYFVNQQFRKDLYLRGAVRLSEVEQRQRLLDLRVVLLMAPDQVPLKVTSAMGEARLQESVYQPLLAILAGNKFAPKTLKELASSAPALNWLLVRQAVTVLVGIGVLSPCQSEADIKLVSKRCAALNRHLCERAQFGNEIELLASPVTGCGVHVGRFGQLFLMAQHQGKKHAQEWAQFAWNILAAQNQRLLKDNQTLETPEENLAELSLRAQTFAHQQLPILKALQIV
jgi:SAM-dependent methyltransferase